MAVIDKVAFLYLQDGKILSTRSKEKDKYYIPGGKREVGETDIETLVREVKEELSVDIVESSAKLYGVFEAQAHGKAEGVVVKMTCYTAEYTGELKADSEIAEIVWLTMADIESVSPVDKLIFADLKSKGLLKQGKRRWGMAQRRFLCWGLQCGYGRGGDPFDSACGCAQDDTAAAAARIRTAGEISRLRSK